MHRLTLPHQLFLLQQLPKEEPWQVSPFPHLAFVLILRAGGLMVTLEDVEADAVRVVAVLAEVVVTALQEPKLT